MRRLFPASLLCFIGWLVGVCGIAGCGLMMDDLRVVEGRCGDGVARAGIEECDDHNTASGDGCSPDCEIEPGWACSGEEPSACERVVTGEPTCGDCSDDNPCTEDFCYDGTCSYTYNSSPCDDQDPCTYSDTCSNGECAGTQVRCNDNNPCTDDSCDDRGSCYYTDNSESCDDQDPCTHDDICSGGDCVGTAYQCDDGNPCTYDFCSGDGTCRFENNAEWCDDDDPCTADDACSDGACAGEAYVCSDADECTVDICNGDGTCSYPADTGADCDDDDPCTQSTTCNASKQCVGGTAITQCVSADSCCPASCTGATDDDCSTYFEYIPSNFDPDALDPALTDHVTLDCGVSIFNSQSLSFSNWCEQPEPTPVVDVASDPDVVILAFLNFTLASGSRLKLEGDRPVILAVFGDATVEGTMDASANGTTPGAGGNLLCGSSAGGDGVGSSAAGGSGGGGGGFGTAGGAGGLQGGSNLGGSGGIARGSATLIPLQGGCPGGMGGGCSNVGAAGGGAVQLSAAGYLTVTGSVSADGGHGATTCGSEGGGTGGGSGGGILLEGDIVDLTGSSLQANGGNGGDGVGGSAGGAGSTSSSSNGSDGLPESNDGAGGGGGGYGRIRVNSLTSCTACL